MADHLRLLFVDDEPRVLEGLTRLFRPQRLVWEVLTAGSGQEALDLMARLPVDVVVSDMRMPGMDGAELLTRVHALHPATVRIMLSGQSDREASLRRFGPCHHYLSKPCDPLQLVAAVKRACDLRLWLADPGLPAWTRRIGDLPTLPAIYRDMMAELRESDPSLVRLAELVEQDIGLAARLLHTVNSVRFGLEQKVSGIAEAVTLIGVEALRGLVLAAYVFDADRIETQAGLDIEDLWDHSLATGRLARAILRAERAPAESCEAAFTAGLLHDCGRLLLAQGDPDGHGTLMRSLSPDARLCDEEELALGMRHDRLGGWLLYHWELPDQVVEAVAWHHLPDRATGVSPLTAVHIADALLGFDLGRSPGPDLPLLARLGWTDRFDAWRTLVEQVRS